MLIEKNSLILAPMAGVTDYVYRKICTQMGAQATVTEMVSAKGFILTPKERLDVVRLRQTSPREHCALQIFGSDADFMAQAAQRLCESRFFALDVNMGCPAPKIVSGGDGSAMLKDLKNAEKVISAVVKASSLPVTVKMRMGWDENSICFRQAGQMLQDAGVAAITLHGRTRQQMYAGKADWNAVGELAAQLSIPVIGNGDVETAQDALAMLQKTGCHAVMVGRGAMGNPWIFRDWTRLQAGLPPQPVTLSERMDTALSHARQLMEHKGENVGCKEMRKHMAWYLKGLRGSAQVREKINFIESYAQLEALLRTYQRDLQNDGAE